MSSKAVEVVAAAIVRDGEVLATQRGYGEQAGGWEFPGGKVEPGETPEQALVREIREELAADVAIERFLCAVEYDYEAFHLSMRVYVCRFSGGTPRLVEHRAARWVDAESIESLEWLPADWEVVRALEEEGIT